MKKIIILVFLNILLFAKDSGVYLELEGGGLVNNEIEKDNNNYGVTNSYEANINIGYQFQKKFRVEYEFRYIKEDIIYFNNYKATGDAIYNSNMINGYYSAYNDTKMVTSFGLGAGISNVSLKNMTQLQQPQADININGVFSYQGILGVGYMYNENITFSFKYKYFSTLKKNQLDALNKNIFSIGVRYLF